MNLMDIISGISVNIHTSSNLSSPFIESFFCLIKKIPHSLCTDSRVPSSYLLSREEFKYIFISKWCRFISKLCILLVFHSFFGDTNDSLSKLSKKEEGILEHFLDMYFESFEIWIFIGIKVVSYLCMKWRYWWCGNFTSHATHSRKWKRELNMSSTYRHGSWRDFYIHSIGIF
jgi:hypothetical protein